MEELIDCRCSSRQTTTLHWYSGLGPLNVSDAALRLAGFVEFPGGVCGKWRARGARGRARFRKQDWTEPNTQARLAGSQAHRRVHVQTARGHGLTGVRGVNTGGHWGCENRGGRCDGVDRQLEFSAKAKNPQSPSRWDPGWDPGILSGRLAGWQADWLTGPRNRGIKQNAHTRLAVPPRCRPGNCESEKTPGCEMTILSVYKGKMSRPSPGPGPGPNSGSGSGSGLTVARSHQTKMKERKRNKENLQR